MMRPIQWSSLALCAWLLAACAPPPFDAVGEGRKLAARDADFANVSRDGKDVEKILSYWTEDARVILSGQPVYDGKAAIRSFVTAALKTPGFKIHWVSEAPVFSTDGTLAWISSVTETSVADDKGTVSTMKSRAVTVWRKDPDGEYRCVMDISNDSPPAS
jgi:ketosteroid isomerase-like protein